MNYWLWIIGGELIFVFRWIHTKRRIHKNIVPPISDLINEESTPTNNCLVKNPHNFKNREKREKFHFGDSSQVTHGISARIQKKFHSTFVNSRNACVIMQFKNPHKTTTDLLQSPFFPDWRRNGWRFCSSSSYMYRWNYEKKLNHRSCFDSLRFLFGGNLHLLLQENSTRSQEEEKTDSTTISRTYLSIKFFRETNFI